MLTKSIGIESERMASFQSFRAARRQDLGAADASRHRELLEPNWGCKPKPSKFLTPSGFEELGGDRSSEAPVCQSLQKSLKRLEASWV